MEPYQVRPLLLVSVTLGQNEPESNSNEKVLHIS